MENYKEFEVTYGKRPPDIVFAITQKDTRRETARQIFDWCEDRWIKEFPNRGKLEDYIEWIKLKSRFLKES
jgi:hypothetical protein